MKIRSVTLFDNLPLDPPQPQLDRLATLAEAARAAIEEAGYEVQTRRLATALGPALARQPRPAEAVAALEARCREGGFGYLSGPLEGAALERLPEVLAATQGVFATAQIVDPADGAILGGRIRDAAAVMRAAAGIEQGFGNLRFGALAHVPPLTPFFPAAYHDGGAPAFALATEAADLAVTACAGATDVAEAGARLREAIEGHATRLAAVGAALADRLHLRFAGIDFSLAPFPSAECSIGGALEALSGAPLGAPGTLAAAAVLTDAIGQARFPKVGFNGLMLPVLEDPVLARRSAEGRLSLSDLLSWSAVCGTGLDTVPLPGDAGAETLARVLWDVAALSARHRKPLTARLMPLPGKVAGDPVHFDFAFFSDGGVLPLEEAPAGPWGATTRLPLGPLGG